ncbi:2-isopropylmalate synthase [Streptomyces sp. L2]|uniref:2-isopropylmalate synthase n=1 Tax=Streptomyces sp. L2 TaxID=2162665 RepID=UPI0019D71153|nr:2-isopropylmalate synthase [Streptomyces sp. L2]
MPTARYSRLGAQLLAGLPDREWPNHVVGRAPLWASVDLRDGNQALPNPMDPARKAAMFDLLVRMGFKEIEVGYPAASEADFSFVRDLVIHDRIPDDVTISVFTPARLDLIDRTFESIKGVDRAMVHLCLATACLWRTVVFSMTRDELREFTLRAAEHVASQADAMPGSRLRFEYSPETFNVTEPEFALDVCDAVTSVWDASPDRPVTLNLPTTVETDSPNVFADQVEWMHRHLRRRESVILSVHPHNDRGTAVASAELSVMAGADRVEGTLFGNGERTGNVCLATLALNLLTRGIDPQLDFCDIDSIRRTVEKCNQMPVHARHPYAGDLVYTAFSGTHQDAIAKGLRALDEQARRTGLAVSELPWQVPYLPIDPNDVGRSYESVIRVNSQSGKGGMAHILKRHYGLDLPRALRVDFARKIQQETDDTGDELTSRRLWEIFTDAYLTPSPWLGLSELSEQQEGASTSVHAALVTHEGPDGSQDEPLTGSGLSAVEALLDALARGGHRTQLHHFSQHPVDGGRASSTASYAYLTTHGVTAHGVGIHNDPAASAATAILNAVNRTRTSVNNHYGDDAQASVQTRSEL